MSTWMTSLNKHSKNSGQKQKNLVMTLKPCPDDKTYYRVRLLGFKGPTDRDDPWIQRFVHQHWGVNKEKGYPVLESEVVCPVTSYVKTEGNKYDACKICTLANKYFLNFKESGWKDKESNKKNKALGRKYQCIIPVYVVNNPNWDGDNGKFRVIILNDKKFVTQFRKIVDKALLTNQVFNGKNAVDCCIHVTTTETKVHEGEPNEYVFKKREIDKIVFSTKPYDIPAITQEMCDSMEFDDTYYTSSTEAEIDAFYRNYCTISNDDIPDGGEIPAFEMPREEKSSASKPGLAMNDHEPRQDIPDDVIDDLTTDPDDLPAGGQAEGASESDQEKPSDDIDADALLADLDLG